MSARVNVALTIGTLAVMLLTTSVIIYFTKDTKDNAEFTQIQADQNNKDIQQLKKDFNEFVTMWENRIKTSNIVNNGTQDKILHSEKNILGNLTAHRHVANYTRDVTLDILNNTVNLINKFNQTNEHGRSTAVDEIINNVNNNTKSLFEQYLDKSK